MIRTPFLTSSFAILLAVAGCGGSTTTTSDAGSDAATSPDSSTPEGDSGVVTDAGRDSGPREDASTTGTAEVHWVTEVEPRTIDTDIALDYAFQYELNIDGDPLVYSLSLNWCVVIAGRDPVCSLDSLSNLPGTGYRRFGVDPSMYAIGENHYTFHLMLERDGVLVSEDTLDVEYDVTACMECVGSTP